MVFVIARSRLALVFDRISEVRWHEKTKIRGSILQMDDALAASIDFNPSSARELILVFLQEYFQSIITEAIYWHHRFTSQTVQEALNNCTRT